MPYTFCEKIGDEIKDISDEIPFDIPDSWEWVRLPSLSKIISAGGDKPNQYSKTPTKQCSVPIFSNGEKNKGLYGYTSEARITEPSITISGRGTIGYSCIRFEPYVPIVRLISVTPLSSVNICYMQIVFEALFEKGVGTSIQQLTVPMLQSKLIPLPPLAEQQRIVEKIEELLPHIEDYEKSETRLTKLQTNFPDQLKKSILQQAVMGKLVPQDENDEPASVLLERIRAEKQQLIKDGKIKKDKHESVIFKRDNSHYEKRGSEVVCIDDELPFDIPDSWCWCRLGSILTKLTDGTHSTPKYTAIGVPFISVKDISNGKLNFDNCKYISENEHQELYSRCNPELNDVLLTKVGTTGIPVIVDTNKQFSLFVSVALLKFNKELIHNEYLVQLINSPLVQKQATENTRGVGNKNWVMRDIANTLIAIPPINEQHRIVAKLKDYFSLMEQM